MSHSKKPIGFIVVIGILTLLNLSLLFVIWKSNHRQKPSWKGANVNRVEFFLEEKLSLNEKQKKKYRQLRKTHFKAVMEKKKEIGKLKIDLYQTIPQPLPDAGFEAAINEISEKEMDIERLTYHHFKSLREVCDEGQRETFDQLIPTILQKKPRRARHQKRKSSKKGQ